MFDTGLARDRHGRACPDHDDVGKNRTGSQPGAPMIVIEADGEARELVETK
jgi:hypothetical protein